MQPDLTGWSGEGDFTQRLIDVLAAMPEVQFLRVEDAPATRADAGFSFISNELFVGFATASRVEGGRLLGVFPRRMRVEHKLLTLGRLQVALGEIPDVGEPDYADEGMLQYLRSERIIPPYQTRGYKLVELVRIYEAAAGGVKPSRSGTEI